MAGKIIADTIETGAGADISTSYVVNGSAKVWADIVTFSSIGDSLNLSSFTDNGAGDYTQNFTSALNNSNYSTSVSGGSGRVSSPTVYWGGYKSSAPTTTAARIGIVYGSGTAADAPDACSSIHGDLA